MSAEDDEGQGPPRGGADARLQALRGYAILDTEADPELDAIARLAARICRAPMALITLVDEGRQWFKAAVGTDLRETPLDVSFCAVAIREAGAMLVVPDATVDPRFASNPAVTGAPGVRFYAGAALETREGHRLGTLCVLDTQPRVLEDDHAAVLALLARQVMTHLELHRTRRELRSAREQGADELRSSDERYGILFDLNPHPMWVYDLETLRFLAVNDAAVRKYGHSRDAFLAMTIEDVRPPEELPALRKNLAERVDGVQRSGEWRHRLADGAIVHVEIATQWLRFSGRPARLVLVNDVSRRVEAELALRASETDLLRAQRIAHLGSWELDLPTGRLRWSDEVHRILGLERDPRATYETFFATVHPDDRARMAAAQSRALAGEAPLDIEHRIVRPDGTVRWVHELGELERDAAGHPLRLTGTVLDVTERNRSERLLASEARVLEVISSGASLTLVLEQVVAGLELTLPGAVASVLVVDPRSTPQRFVVAPSLAAPFRDAPSHDEPGEAGSGPAAVAASIARGADPPLVASDIAADPRWAAHRELALSLGYVACWSAPIVDAAGEAAATVALYFRERRDPGPRDRDLMSRVAQIVAIAIQRDRKELALRSSEDQVRRTFLHAPIGIVISTVDGKIVDANTAFCRLVGHSLDELQQSDIESLSHPDDRAQSAPIRSDLLEGRSESFVVEKRYRHRAGHHVWCRVSVSALRDAYGVVTRLIAVAEDITERRHAEIARLESESRFRLLSEVASDVVWDWEIESDRLWWNEGVEALFGYRREELPPTLASWSEQIHPEDLPRVFAGFQAALESDANQWADEYRFLLRDGREVYVLDRGRILRDPAGKAIRMVGGMTDLTERRRVEDTLREQATLLDKAQDAIMVRDLDQRILYWNRSAERVYGWSAREALGHIAHDLLCRDAGTFLAATATLLTAGEWAGELEQLTQAGKTITVECRWTLVRDERGEPRSILAVHTDITQRRSMEAQFLRAQRLESIGTLAGGIAHDLNNVLAPILIATTTLREAEQDPSRIEDLAMIETCAQRGADMVRQLLSFARGTDDRRTIVPLGTVAHQVRQMIGDTFPRNIALRLTVAPDLWLVDADSTQLHQVLTNLCVNARDAMPQGGTLRIALENVTLDPSSAGVHLVAKPGPFVRLTLEDTGSGMPADVVDRIFEPFFTTKEIGKGTGLGLSTVHAIVRNHGGFVLVHSEVGKGTRFEVHLPAAVSLDAARAAAAPRPALPRGDGELLLLVDDEESILKVTRRTLEKHGYRVLCASNGAEAVALYAEQGPAIALVLTDMNMPIMDGPATIVALRAMNPAVRIVGSSGLVTDDRDPRAVRAGVDTFVPKPFTADVLLSTIRKSLGKPSC